MGFLEHKITYSIMNNEESKEFELDLLKQEYFFLENTIEDYNRQIWAIKSLGLTATGSVIILMIKEEARILNHIDVLIFSIPILFWVLESQWKHFQRGFYYRVAVIESIFSKNFDFKSPMIYGSWRQSFHRSPKPYHVNYWRDGFFNLSVSVTYILEILLLALLLLLRNKLIIL